MDSALRDTTWQDLTVKLEEAQETIGRKRKLESMIRKAEKEQGTVPDHIYRKVQQEYRKQLDELTSTLVPLESEISEARESISLDIKELETDIGKAQDDLAEIEFRFTVGEFDEAACEDKKQPLQSVLDEKLERKQSLIDSLGTFDSFTDAFSSDEGAAPADGSAPSSSAPPGDQDAEDEPQEPSTEAGLDFTSEFSLDSLGESPEESSTKPQPERSEKAGSSDSDFVNPNEWLADVAGTAAPDTAPGADAVRNSNSELFESFLDNTPGQAQPAQRPQTPPEAGESRGQDTAGATPMLVLKSKSGTEKRIPVLPITLTIGREHDNNIELKDEDVARYHARIVFKSGQYVLQSLEASRSTLVNGKHVTEAVLQDADTITIGKNKMFFMME